jgi:hypothetical protein
MIPEISCTIIHALSFYNNSRIAFILRLSLKSHFFIMIYFSFCAIGSLVRDERKSPVRGDSELISTAGKLSSRNDQEMAG